jgi:hypothetical protein
MSLAEMTIDDAREAVRGRSLPVGVRCRLVARRGSLQFRSGQGCVELYRKRGIWRASVAIRATGRTTERCIESLDDLLAAVHEIGEADQ